MSPKLFRIPRAVLGLTPCVCRRRESETSSRVVPGPESLEDAKLDFDKRLELAYEAGQARLSGQDTTLANIRSRANNLLATSALLTSFSSGIGLINTDPNKGTVLPTNGAWLLLVVTVIVGAAVIYVLWPAKDWHFGPSAGKIMTQFNEGKSEVEIRKYVIGKMIEGIELNVAALKKKQRAFRFAAVFLLVEVVELVALLTLRT
jgi:hypothetical protein